MALFNRIRNILISEGMRNQKECREEKQDTDSLEVLPAEKKQISASENDRQMRVEQLTPRERDLFLLLLEGFTLKESAKQLLIKYSTANTHMTSIYKKLGVKSRAELIINYREILNKTVSGIYNPKQL